MRDYIKRYNNEMTQVDGYDYDILSSIIKGLGMEKLWWLVSKKPFTSYSNILARVEKYANTEEGFHNQNWEKEQVKERKIKMIVKMKASRPDQFPKRNQFYPKGMIWSLGRSNSFGLSFTSFIELEASRQQILM